MHGFTKVAILPLIPAPSFYSVPSHLAISLFTPCPTQFTPSLYTLNFTLLFHFPPSLFTRSHSLYTLTFLLSPFLSHFSTLTFPLTFPFSLSPLTISAHFLLSLSPLTSLSLTVIPSLSLVTFILSLFLPPFSPLSFSLLTFPHSLFPSHFSLSDFYPPTFCHSFSLLTFPSHFLCLTFSPSICPLYLFSSHFPL